MHVFYNYNILYIDLRRENSMKTYKITIRIKTTSSFTIEIMEI